jgi:hypothetical protein
LVVLVTSCQVFCRATGRCSHAGICALDLAGVRLCRYRFSPTGDLGYSGIRGAEGLRYRVTVYKRTLPPTARWGGGSVLLLILKRWKIQKQGSRHDRFCSTPEQVALELKTGRAKPAAGKTSCVGLAAGGDEEAVRETRFPQAAAAPSLTLLGPPRVTVEPLAGYVATQRWRIQANCRTRRPIK